MNPMHGRPGSVSRQEKGQKLFEQGRVEESAFGWYVHSDSGTTYEVEQTFDGRKLPYWCPCKDHERRPSTECKHAWAVEYYRRSVGMLPWLEDAAEMLPAVQPTIAEEWQTVAQFLEYALTADRLDDQQWWIEMALKKARRHERALEAVA